MGGACARACELAIPEVNVCKMTARIPQLVDRQTSSRKILT